MVDMVDAVAKDAQDTWSQLLGSRYERTRIVLFRDSIDSACGYAEAATGRFIALGRKVYLDLGFSTSSRAGRRAWGLRPGYVITHELGHHVQTLLGVDAQARRGAAPAPTAPRSRSSCRPIATPASGATPPGKAAGFRRGTWSSSRGRGRSLARRRGHRRRSPAEDVNRARRPGSVHARHVGATRAMVHQAWTRRPARATRSQGPRSSVHKRATATSVARDRDSDPVECTFSVGLRKNLGH